MQKTSAQFYNKLPTFTRIQNILNLDQYRPLPEDWYVVITDVKSSTQAIQEGRYKDVNVAGVSSIIAIKNACEPVDVPFIFGGDGTTCFIPNELLEPVRSALSETKRRAKNGLNIDLRVAVIPMADLKSKNKEIFLSKMKLSDSAYIAMAKGSGLAEAEYLAKQTDRYEVKEHLNFARAHEGLECRWNPIQAQRGKILTIIAQSIHGDMETYNEVLVDIYKSVEVLQLVKAENLSTAWPPKHLIKELQMKYSGLKRHILFYLLSALLFVLTLLVRSQKYKPDSAVSRYLQELSTNTDFVKFDDTLKMVIDVTDEEQKKIIAVLEMYRSDKKIYYGVHISDEAMMTCFIQTNKNHIHFVDGGDGGYAMAAKQLKAMKAGVDL